MATSTFKLGLPYESEPRDSLTMKPSENMHQLIRQREKHKRLEGDRLHSNGKASSTSQYQREQ